MERSSSKKRKAVTKDVDEAAVAVPGDEFEGLNLNGALEDGESSASEEEESVLEDEGSDDESDVPSISIGSDEVPSDEEEGSGLIKVPSNKAVDISVLAVPNGEKASTEVENQSEDEMPNYRVVKDANGNDRFLYDEINPDDDSEYSGGNDEQNTIGDIPLSFYDSYPHIGYNINGKKIMRPAKGEALDALLDSIEVPKGWTGLTDPSTGKPLNLSQEELQLLRQVQMNEIPGEGYDPYEPTVEWFTSKTETMPLSAAPEPKRRFIPSKHEAKRVMKIVKAIREGRIQPYRAPEEDTVDEEGVQNYDVWANEEARPDHAMHMPAPKLPPPGFDESYHPPAEYLPDNKERQQWEKADEEDREKDYLPTDHSALPKVPGYERFIKEKFERCLDLYLAPRVRRTKLNIDPESLLPKLPNPDELKPFPTHQELIFRGHKSRVRTVAIDPTGMYVASGGDDCTARIWSVQTARELWSVSFGEDNPVNVVRWRPGKDAIVLAIAAGDEVHLCVPQIPADVISELETTSQSVLDAGWGYAASNETTSKSARSSWTRPSSNLKDRDVVVTIALGYSVKSLSFHPAGNHFVTVCPATTVPASQAIAIHTISKHQTQHPFRKRLKGGGSPQAAHFHPTRSILFVANQRVIRSYDLTRQTLLKIIQPGARWISSFSVHPTSSSTAGSDNLIVGSYDRRLLWMDLELSARPYKTLRFHEKAIRTVKFHPNVNRFPLFADASDDGSIQVFHGLVTGDVMSNATIVPLKVLKGHRVKDGVGIVDIDWHPTEPWLVSAGGDGTCRLWLA